MDASAIGPGSAGVLTVISDTICPWCYVGKRRLDLALADLGAQGMRFEVEWRPFQLNPEMPDRGKDRREYRAAKFGAAKSDALDQQMVEVGGNLGIEFRYDLIDRTPNTLASHVMIADARRAGGLEVQNAAVEALFAAYFVEGRDVGRPDVLRDIARQVGFEHGPSVDADLWELVQQEELSIREAGVSGVPTYLLDGHYLLTGAQPADMIAAAILHSRGATIETAFGRHLEDLL
jgi:predicted DsbA family dithiol-disulfide isomerase